MFFCSFLESPPEPTFCHEFKKKGPELKLLQIKKGCKLSKGSLSHFSNMQSFFIKHNL